MSWRNIRLKWSKNQKSFFSVWILMIIHGNECRIHLFPKIGRFQVTSCLCVKTSLLVKPFIWKYVRLQVDFHANQTHSHVKGKIALGLGTWKFLPGLCFKVLKASLGVLSDLHIIIVFWLSGVGKSTWITCSHSSNKRLCKTSYKSETR